MADPGMSADCSHAWICPIIVKSKHKLAQNQQGVPVINVEENIAFPDDTAGFGGGLQWPMS